MARKDYSIKLSLIIIHLKYYTIIKCQGFFTDPQQNITPLAVSGIVVLPMPGCCCRRDRDLGVFLHNNAPICCPFTSPHHDYA